MRDKIHKQEIFFGVCGVGVIWILMYLRSIKIPAKFEQNRKYVGNMLLNIFNFLYLNNTINKSITNKCITNSKFSKLI
jgi:hypothetical protein